MSEADKFEVALYEYRIELAKLKARCIRKYGSRAKKWFA